MTATEPGLITTKQLRELHALLREHGVTGDQSVHAYLNRSLAEMDADPIEHRDQLSTVLAAKMITDLRDADTLSGLGGLAQALIKVQRALPAVAKSKTAHVPMKAGGSYSYTYADLGDVTAAAMPLLTANGFAFSCCPRGTDRGYELVGVLLHKSGERLEGALPLHGNDPQQIGGALTYHRRYLLGCMLGIVTDDDVDGRQAVGASRTRDWDGPSTVELLNAIDADATRAGVTYEQATANLRRDLGGIDVEALDAVEPWLIAPFAQKVREHADKVIAAAAAAETPAEGTTAPVGDTADPSDPGDPWATPKP